ncbi:unnamed protein product, partial [Adineta steineri]
TFLRCTVARKTFVLGEFNLGRFGVPIAVIASIWLTITSIIMFFPSEYPVTKDNMNYTVVIAGGVLLLAGAYWIISARHWFVGPKRVDADPTSLPPGHVASEDNTIRDVPSDAAASRV